MGRAGTLHFEDGTRVSRDISILGTSRANVPGGAPEEAGGSAPRRPRRFGATMESLQNAVGQRVQVVVERAMYSSGTLWPAGANAVATRLR